MVQNIKLLFSCIIVAAFAGCSRATLPVVNNKYQKEGYSLSGRMNSTNRAVPDSSNWGFEKGFVRNNEEQWYQEPNAWCENGVLILEARKEKKPNPA